MHYRGTNGALLESREEFSVLPDHSAAVALRGQHRVYAPASLYDNAVAITLPSGEILRTRPIAISYADGTNNVLVAEITNSTAQLSPDHCKVLWPGCFTDIDASIVLVNRRHGAECDLVIHSAPPPPSAFGLSDSSPTLRLQLLTEVFNSPEPTLESQAPAGTNLAVHLPAAQSPSGPRDAAALRFPSMRMPAGRAFFIGAGGAESPTPAKSFKVKKSWIHYQNRVFLLEEIPYSLIASDLRNLHASATPVDNSKLLASAGRAESPTPPSLAHRLIPSSEWSPPPYRPITSSTKTVELALADLPARPGFILDYELNGTVTNFVLSGDSLVTGPFYVAGVLTVSPNSVTKFTNSPSAKISFSGPLACRSDFYSDAIFTSQNDNSIGATAPYSTGSPAQTLATYLEDTSDADNAYSHLRFDFAGTAVSITSGFTGNEFWHCQFLNCGTAISSAAERINLYNTLVAKCSTALSGWGLFTAQNATFDQCGTLGNGFEESASLANCILTAVTNIDASYTLDTCLQAASGAGIYNPVGGGNYYLNAVLQNSGCTNLHPALALDLRQLTTQPPVVISNTILSGDLNLSPQAQRDTDIPDQGFHYASLDFAVSAIRTTNAVNITLAPDTAVGVFRGTWGGNGFSVNAGARMSASGTATSLCRLVSYNCVQEQPVSIWSEPLDFGLVTDSEGYAAAGALDFHFTQWSSPASDVFLLYSQTVAANVSDSQFQGGMLVGVTYPVNLTNCLLENVTMEIDPTVPAGIRNCTFIGGTFYSFGSGGITNYVIKDNIFDHTALINDLATYGYDGGHNAFVAGFDRLYPTNTSDILLAASPAYQIGPLGNYYLPANNPLVNGGTWSATNGLYHFTTALDQRKETNSIVDLGFHAVALAPAAPPTIWCDDSVPAGSTLWLNNDHWTWTNNPTPFSGSSCHVSDSYPTWHQHVFYASPTTLTLGPDDTLFCHVYLNPTNVPSEVMLQFEALDGSWWYHRAFWGKDIIQGWGARTYMGAIPPAGGWVRLEIPARVVGLVGLTIDGIGFTLGSGSAAWDYAGVVGQRSPVDSDADGFPDYLDRDNNGLPIPPDGGPLARLAVDAWKTSCEDKFNFNVTDLTGYSLKGGHFDLFAYFDGLNATYVRTLQPWGPNDAIANGSSHLFTFCTTDRSLLGIDCMVVYRGDARYASSPKFRIAVRDSMALVMTNSTLVLNPCHERDNCEPGHDDWITPAFRPICGGGVTSGCDSWPQPLPTFANGGSPHVDNFYKPTDPPQYVNVWCPKQGFKNVYAMKQWHGIWGPRSDMLGPTYSSMNGNCVCQTVNGPVNTVDDTKYLQMHASGVSTNHYIYNNGDNPSGGSVERDCSIAPLSGKATYAASNLGDVDGVAGASKAIRDVRLADLPGIYCGKVADYSKELLGLPSPGGPVDVPARFTDGVAPAMEWNYSWSFPVGEGEDAVTCTGHSTGFVRLDLAGGTYSCSYDYYWESSTETEVIWRAESNSEAINVAAASVTSSRTWSQKTSAVIEDTWGSEAATVTYLQPYTASQLNTDIDALLATWNLLDDVEYPWRDGGGTTSGPLVTYNERLALQPSIKFDLENIGDDTDPVWGPPPVDTSPPPWPSQPDGAILGAPLPVHGPGGVLYSYQHYFNFYHVNYIEQETDLGHPAKIPISFGAYSPFANATQWTDDDQARVFPAGPFWAYGCGDHFGFWLKNPYVTDSNGEWEQGGYWGLVKCKWAETINSPSQTGNDFVFKNWTFNFRDFIESYRWNSAGWYRNNIETTCAGLAETTPVRFTPISIPFPRPGGGYHIDLNRGSWWLSEMNSTALHYNFDCCRPAIYVQPNSPGPDRGNGLFAAMPPAICDERYGSLWMGRVDQSTGDAHVCDNYVANLNDGTATPPQCDPQIYLDLVWHQPGGYELIYAPLPLNYGGDPPPPLTVRIDIARKNGQVVPDDQKHSNGSVVQIVPQVNPGNLYPGGIFLSIPTLSIDPPSALNRVHLKLRKVSVSNNPATIRVYRRTPGQAHFAIFLDEFTDERMVGPADLGCDWRLDSTSGGVVDLALIAEAFDGTELTRDTVRVSSTPAEPAPGRIVFVNPSSSSSAPPYDNFTANAAHTIADAVAIMQADDNILIAPADAYVESGGMTLPTGGVIGGLAGRWETANPSDSTWPLSDAFEFSSLPVVNNTKMWWQPPLFQCNSPTPSPDGQLAIAGLQFVNCASLTDLGGQSGSAIHFENVDLQLQVNVLCCRFATNSAADFGGAIYLSSVEDGAIWCCQFDGNQVTRVEVDINQYAKGMGGAVSSFDSTLDVEHCSFTNDSAQVARSLSPALPPPHGSVAGGGDVYTKNGSLTIARSRFSRSRAGFPMPTDTDVDPPGGNHPEFFTGDGGSILVHCPAPGVTLQITHSLFTETIGFGNGGAICLSYDSSPLGRGYFVKNPLDDPYLISLSGACSGGIYDTVFSNCKGGWQGGAISANGRGIQLTIDGSKFLGCQAGTAHKRDGKGGAISVAGGVESPALPQNDVSLSGCVVSGCTATGNGGALYCTVRGRLTVTDGTTVDHCSALNDAGSGWAEWEGLGGALHASAGGWAIISGNALLATNTAKSCGGAISIKSAHVDIGSAAVTFNEADGAMGSGWGNGGGAYVTTCAYEAEGMAANVYQEDGTLTTTSIGALIEQNTAARFGGGLYVGIYDNGVPQQGTGVPRLAAARIDIPTQVIRSNNCVAAISVSGSLAFPSQVVAENVQAVPAPRLMSPVLGFNTTVIEGSAPLSDVGIYTTNSISITGSPIYVPGTLLAPIIVQ
jgi:hypothetical protein